MNTGLTNLKSLRGILLRVTLLLLSIAGLIVLNTAVSFAQTSYAIDYLASSRSHTATVIIKDKAADVWQSVVDVAKKRNPKNLKIKEENKEKLKFEATKITGSGEELWFTAKVKPVSETSCRLTVTATMGGGKSLEKDMKDMVTEVLMGFCQEKGLTCNIVE